MGEYGRALAMANAALERWPQAVIHFVLSREAPYAADAPFPNTLLPSSPTFHPKEVSAVIRTFQPTVVIFDNAGRTAQLRAARLSGAHVVFVSARSRQRRKAFRLLWMNLIDEHWIAYPRLLAGAVMFSERMKLRLFGRPRVRFLNPVIPPPDPQLAQAVLGKLGIQANEYIVVVPGGGTDHVGTVPTLRQIAEAAARMAGRGVHTVLIGFEAHRIPESRFLHATGRVSVPVLVELLRQSRLVVANGGYTLLQALACDRACIGIALVKDQAQRIDRCVSAGIALRGEATPPRSSARLWSSLRIPVGWRRCARRVSLQASPTACRTS